MNIRSFLEDAESLFETARSPGDFINAYKKYRAHLQEITRWTTHTDNHDFQKEVAHCEYFLVQCQFLAAAIPAKIVLEKLHTCRNKLAGLEMDDYLHDINEQITRFKDPKFQ